MAARSVGAHLAPAEAATALRAQPPVPADEEGAATFGIIFETVAPRVDPVQVPALLTLLIRQISTATQAIQLHHLAQIVVKLPGSPSSDVLSEVLTTVKLGGGDEADSNRQQALKAVIRKVSPEQVPVVASVLLERIPETADSPVFSDLIALWTHLLGPLPVPQARAHVDKLLAEVFTGKASQQQRDFLPALATRLPQNDLMRLLNTIVDGLTLPRNHQAAPTLRQLLTTAAARVAPENRDPALAVLAGPLLTAAPAAVRALGTAIAELIGGESASALRTIDGLIARRMSSPTAQAEDYDAAILAMASRVPQADRQAAVDRIVTALLSGRDDRPSGLLLTALQNTAFRTDALTSPAYERLLAAITPNTNDQRLDLVVRILKSMRLNIDPEVARRGLESIVRQVAGRAASSSRKYSLESGFHAIVERLPPEAQLLPAEIIARAFSQTIDGEARSAVIGLLQVLPSNVAGNAQPVDARAVIAAIEQIARELSESQDRKTRGLPTALEDLVKAAGEAQLPRIVQVLRDSRHSSAIPGADSRFDASLTLALSRLTAAQAKQEVLSMLQQLRAGANPQVAEWSLGYVFARMSPDEAARVLGDALADFRRNHIDKLSHLSAALTNLPSTTLTAPTQSLIPPPIEDIRTLSATVATQLAAPQEPITTEEGRARHAGGVRLTEALQAILQTLGGAAGDLGHVVTALQRRDAPLEDDMLVTATRAVASRFSREQTDAVMDEMKGLMAWSPNTTAAQNAAVLMVALVSSWSETERLMLAAEILAYPSLDQTVTQFILETIHSWSGGQSPEPAEGLQANLEWLASKSGDFKNVLSGEPRCPVPRIRELRCP